MKLKSMTAIIIYTDDNITIKFKNLNLFLNDDHFQNFDEQLLS